MEIGRGVNSIKLKINKIKFLIVNKKAQKQGFI